MTGWRTIRNRIALRMARHQHRSSVSVAGDWGRFRGDSDDRYMLPHYGRQGNWSAGTVALLAQTARDLVANGEPPPLLLDVGAGLGMVSIGVLRQAPGSALAIESHPQTCAHLRHNIVNNRMEGRIEAMRLAAGNPARDGCSVHMQRTPGNTGDSWVIKEAEDGKGTPMVRLDDLTRPHADVPLLLKVDVQGYEPKVLAGGRETLRRAKLAIVEFWPFGIRRMRQDPTDFACQLLGHANNVALIRNEHKVTPIDWTSRDSAMDELTEIIADGRPEQQVEVLIDGTD